MKLSSTRHRFSALVVFAVILLGSFITVQAEAWSPSLRLRSNSSRPLSLTPWRPRPVLGPQKTLILLVQFQDIRFQSTMQGIQSLMDTVDGWFRESSYGKISIDYTIHEDLITLPNTMADYGAPKAGDQRGDDVDRTHFYFYDSLTAIPDATLGQYRHIVLIHAGGDEAVTGDAYDIWSKCDCSGPVAEEDPANEASWVITDQAGQITHAFWGVSTFSEDESWPIVAHEYTHSLGVSDLYVYGSDGYSEGPGIGFWSNMATGAFLDPPSDIDGWSKYILGWVQAIPVNPMGQNEYTIYTLESNNEPKALFIPFGSNGEYYFIHARRKAGTDRALPSEGIIVFKINPNREESLVDEELALISDANPTTPPQCAQYDNPFRELCQEVDAPYNEKGTEYPFTYSTFTATIVLNDDTFWAPEAGMGFKVEAVGEGAFKLTFASSTEELGITPSTATTTSESTATRCAIATAAYGSDAASDLVRMRYVRDSMIGSTAVGRRLVDAFNAFYYSWSPPVARIIGSSAFLRYIFRALLIPVVWVVEMAADAFEVTVLITGDASAASVIAFSLAAFLSLFAYVGIPALVLKFGVEAMRRPECGGDS